MNHINTVALSGILIDKDPETKTLNSGSMICTAWLHSPRVVKRGDKQYNEDAKVELSCWGVHAQTMSFLKLGDEVVVKGRMATREWQKDAAKAPMRFQSIAVEELVVIKSRAQMDAPGLPPASDQSVPW